jgi:mannose-6-phosphate isomerase
MVKLIDAKQRLSVQVHPDDELARSMEVGENGKTECWVFLASGGEVFQGTRKGIDPSVFRRALDNKQLETVLNRFEASEGDVFFLPSRTLHAIGEDCLVYELQQTSDITFRVYDWDRMGLDGKPRQLHVEESLRAIDFSPQPFGPIRPNWRDAAFGKSRRLAECAYFSLEELGVDGPVELPTEGSFILITCLTGTCLLSAPMGEVALPAMRTALIPADAGSLRVEPLGPATLLVARPGVALIR